MSLRQTFLFLCVLMAAGSGFAYEVVLKNGKVLTGEVLSEDHTTITLKDTSGVKLQIKKSTIDSAQTEKRNQISKAEPTPAANVEPSEPIDSGAAKQKPKARVYKKEDLEKMPELTILGDEQSPDEEALRNESAEEAAREQDVEAAWNEVALRIDDRIKQAEQAYQSSKNFCDRVIPGVEDLNENGYVRLSAEQYEERRRIACMEAESAAKELREAQAEYEEFLEDARKKGIPPGWVDPDRIRN